MQFVADGPDIPDALLQTHEEGRLVFFCGAGISYPAGLPGFRGLVDKVYASIGTTHTPVEQKAYERCQFDATLDLLERRLPGQRIAVREAVAAALKPRRRRKGVTDTHAALLQLARTRDGALRMVTTNFDRIFERVAKRNKQKLAAFAAPMLPIPKNSRWDGLVYLHGLLPEQVNDTALNRLVLTSGDFGLAYLTERWAARFVSELFRNYVVCFVGYSIGDPVLRYMMDALAADRMLGEVIPQAYALGDCKPGEDDSKTIEWQAKGVTPVLYETPSGDHAHAALHRTLNAWAETYRDGVLGKEHIVVKYAYGRPFAGAGQDNAAGQMLWALSDESGLPAKRFADLNPAPPLAWLKIFAEKRYRQSDLARFGMPTRAEIDENLRFSLLRRPAPHTHAPPMSLVSSGEANGGWDKVMHHLARWLVRHLNDPDLVVWLAQQGGRLHDNWLWLIDDRLNHFAHLEREGKTAELAEIRANAPNAIPGPLMRTLWHLLLTGRVKSPRRDWALSRWKNQLKRDGLTTTLRLELREMLSPKIALKESFRWHDGDENSDSPERLRQLVDWELVLAADRVHASLCGLDDQRWREALPVLHDDFQQLLRDALDLFRELDESNDRRDRSRRDLPSISPRRQKRGLRDWVALIELLRDAWQEIQECDPARAKRIARNWFDMPYPTFKRLALFAASRKGCIAPGQWVDWLTNDDAWWLWSVHTQQEAMRLLVSQGARLPPKAGGKLERAILAGPPPAMHPDGFDSEGWQFWLRLAGLEEGGRTLGEDAAQRFADLSTANPKWKLASQERGGVLHWMSGAGDPDHEGSRDIAIAPRKRQELVKWLKQRRPDRRPFYDDTWPETCRTRFFHSFFALCDLAKEDQWPAGRWGEALHAWSKEGKTTRSWRFAAPLVKTMPDEILQEAAYGVAWWLEAVSKSIDRHEMVLLTLCQRVLTLPHQHGVNADDPLNAAINHPVGRVTQALLNLWLTREPNDHEIWSSDIEPLFTRLCDSGIEIFRHGRVLLASHLTELFRVVPRWTETKLLPLLDWKTCPIEAKAAWEGFLWNPHLYPKLLIAFKAQFLETAHHYADLGEHSREFATFLTYAALGRVDGYTDQDFRIAVGALPPEGLCEAALTLSRALESVGEQREDYWRNRIQPFWQNVWPKSLDLITNDIVESLAHTSIMAGDEFPAALLSFRGWLQPIEDPSYVVRLLHKSKLSERFPEDALRFLDATIQNQSWALELGQCLTAIAKATPALEQDHRFQRLAQCSRRHDN